MSTQASGNAFFSPKQISGCTLWLDAADTSTLTLAGTNVTQWNDKSGNGTNLTVGTGAPTLAKVNGLTSVNFNGASRMVKSSYAGLQGVQHVNWFAVANPSLTNINYGLLIGTMYTTVNSQNDMYIHTNNVNLFYRISPPTGSPREINTPITGGTAMIASSVTNLQTGIYGTFYNGVGTTASNGLIGTQDSNLVNLYVGNDNYSGDAFITGTISECLLYTQALTTEQRQQIEGYLAWKWGLQGSLPSTHPYKNSPIPPLLSPPTTLPITLQNLQSVFDPRQISGCSLWLDAADTTTITLSVSNVTQWRDKSGNVNNANQANVTYQPIYGAFKINNIPVLTFTAKYMSIPSFSFTQVAVYIVFQNTTFTPYGGPVEIGNFAFFYAAPSSKIGIGRTGVTDETLAVWTGLLNTSTPTVYGGEVNLTSGTNTNLYFNGTTVASSSTSSTGGAIYNNIGSASGTSTTGYMAEVLIYKTIPSQSQRQQIEGYLAWKWGLQANLPRIHPYKVGPPFSPTITAPSRSIIQTGGAWNPTRISGCGMWLDAADSTTLTLVGSKVSQWLDKSGSNNNAFETTDAWRPTYDVLNKRIFFNASQNQLSVVDPGVRPTNIFIVANTITIDNEQHVLRKGNDGASDFEYLIRFTPTNTLRGTYVTTTSTQGTIDQLPPISRTDKQIISMEWNNATMRMYQNGTQSGPDTTLVGIQRTAVSGATNLRIGAVAATTTNVSGPNATLSLNGYIYEILFYNKMPTTQQRQQVEGYLAWKWGLQKSLPAGHPWANWPPPPS